MRRGARIVGRADGCAVMGVFVCAAAGCLPTSDPGLASRDPAMRIDAMATAAETKDRSAIPGLIQRLDSQDGGERLLAIVALERITGDRLGYDHEAPIAEREAGVERWRAWARGEGLLPRASVESVR